MTPTEIRKLAELLNRRERIIKELKLVKAIESVPCEITINCPEQLPNGWDKKYVTLYYLSAEDVMAGLTLRLSAIDQELTAWGVSLEDSYVEP